MVDYASARISLWKNHASIKFSNGVNQTHLQGKSSSVVVIFSVDQQNGFLHFIRQHEWTHLNISLLCLPQSSLLRLHITQPTDGIRLLSGSRIV
jgi:hypothetical protein